MINSKYKPISSITNDKGTIKNIKTIKPEEVSVDFRYYIYRPFKFKKFTNFVKNYDDYLNVQDVLYRDFIPYCQNRNFNQLEIDNKHNHKIDNREKEEIIEILINCKNENLTNLVIGNDENYDINYYQFYMPGAMRVISIIKGSIIFVLFTDPHHLIYRDEKFDKDYDSYRYEPKLINEERVVQFNEIEIEQCYDCKHLKKFLES